MTGSKLPAVRLGYPGEEDPTVEEIEVDLQPSSGSKFGFAWPGSPTSSQQHSDPSLQHDLDHDPSQASNDVPATEADSAPPDGPQQETIPPRPPLSTSNDTSSPPTPPRLSRAFSTPSPAQLYHLRHPRRSFHLPRTEAPTPRIHETSDEGYQELALELADSVQMAVQTLLQLSPPHLFDPAKEQFSACSVQMPTPSLTALLTSMKNLNYISANIRTLGSPKLEYEDIDGESTYESLSKDEFDIGEVMQSVGDSLGGVAADAQVDLVLHHGDALKHIGVKGDECGLSYALCHIIHQVLLTARPGDSIEVGLSMTGSPLEDGSEQLPALVSSAPSPMNAESPLLDADGPLICTFDIAHKFTTYSVHGASSVDSPGEDNMEELSLDTPSACFGSRPEPRFDSTILRRLLRHIGGTLQFSLQPRSFSRGRCCELTVTLDRGPSLAVLHLRHSPTEDDVDVHAPSDVQFAREPSIDELTAFAEMLRGKKVAFHASSQGSFANHLTRYLTAWGMDISHVPTDGAEEKDPAEDTPITLSQSGYGSVTSSPGVGMTMSPDNIPPIVDSASDTPSENKPISGEGGLSFIIIDDDVLVLRRMLLQHRAEVMPSLQLHSRKRPSLAAHHRPRSSPSIRNTLLAAAAQQQVSPPSAFSPVPIVHFTSLSRYKLVKDVIQALILMPGSLMPPGSSPFLPEVIVIPKPAGPRRILAALHTAVHKPIVDPFFSPIATSPMSPNGSLPPFISGRKSSGGAVPGTSSRGPERSTRSGPDASTTVSPSTPLSIPEGLGYFSDAAARKLGGNAASGLVIQSPDGRPAGIFFQPQSRTSSSRSDLAMTRMERDQTLPLPASQRSRRSSSRKIDADDIPELEESFVDPRSKPEPVSPKAAGVVPTKNGGERPRLVKRVETRGSFKSVGRTVSTGEREGLRVLSSSDWREATQKLAKLSVTPATPQDSAPDSAVPSPATQPSSTMNSPPSLGHKQSSSGAPRPITRPPTSPTVSDSKKSVNKRPNPKSPGSSATMKKSRTFGNNIVPPISVLIVEGRSSLFGVCPACLNALKTDNAINQTILSTFMRRNKIKYEVAWNGREAVEKWRNGNFHLILMDIQMPVMDGIEATKEIRRLEKAENNGHFPPSPGESSRRSDTPDSNKYSSNVSTPFRSQVIIVALTASSLQSDRVAALAAGCNDFLTKPVTNSWLNDKIIEWGSIKALQMWAELRPEMARNLNHDQAAQAQAVANRLHVPPGSNRASPLGSPLKDSHLALTSDSQPAETGSNQTPFQSRLAGTSNLRHSSNKGSLSSDSSPDHSPTASDDEAAQDPITEPPAVIRTPVQSTKPLPNVDDEPAQITGEEALLQYLEESKLEADIERPTLLGQRGMVSMTGSNSIASVLHDAGIGDTETSQSTGQSKNDNQQNH